MQHTLLDFLPKPSLSITSSAHWIRLRVFVFEPDASWAPRRRRTICSGETERDEAVSSGVIVWVTEPAAARREVAWPGARCVRPLGRDRFRVESIVGRWIGEAGAVIAGEDIFEENPGEDVDSKGK